MTRWTTLLLDSAQLSALPRVPAEDVLRHADLVAARKPKPVELYRRWDRQQWSAEDLSLQRDHAMLHDERVPAGMRAMLSNAIATFIIGEYTGLDMLGPILTGSPEQHNPETLAYSHARTPFPRLGRPDDVAGAALFLASDDSGYVSGINLLVDGGWMAY